MMKRVGYLIVLLVIFSFYAGCGAKNPTIKNGTYVYGNDPKGVNNATISISDKEITFVFDLLSSYMNIGTYTIKDNLLTMVTDDGLYHYVFQISEDTLIFKKDKSSSVKLIDSRLGVQVVDNSVFKLKK
jgi:hypothetical protein